MTTFATALRHYRTRAGWSLTKLGVEAGVYHQAIMRYERGVKHPRRETVEALAGAMGLSPLDSDRLRLAAGFAPLDLVGLVKGTCCDLVAANDLMGEAWDAGLRLQILAKSLREQGRDLNAICRRVTP